MSEHLSSLGRDQIVAPLSRGSIGFRHQKSYNPEHGRESIDSGGSEEHAETPRMEGIFRLPGLQPTTQGSQSSGSCGPTTFGALSSFSVSLGIRDA